MTPAATLLPRRLANRIQTRSDPLPRPTITLANDLFVPLSLRACSLGSPMSRLRDATDRRDGPSRLSRRGRIVVGGTQARRGRRNDGRGRGRESDGFWEGEATSEGTFHPHSR